MTSTQPEHDNLVRTHALRLLSEGYQVWARLEGWFDLPDFINGYRPDIVGKREDQYVIIEIEKGDIDWPKLSALRQFQAGRPNVELQVIPLHQDFRKTRT